MGFLRNTNNEISAAASQAGSTPSYVTFWSASTGGSFAREIALLDDTSGNTPTYTLALGDRIQFDAGDLALQMVAGSDDGEWLIEQLLTGINTLSLFAQFHSGDPGNAHTANIIATIARKEIAAWTYAAT